MSTKELKFIFEKYCRKKIGAEEKKLFGMEYENFIMAPANKSKERKFSPIQIDGDSGVFNVLDNLVELTKNSDDPLEKVFDNGMLLSLKRASGSKITIEPGGQIELSDAPRSSLIKAYKSLKDHIRLLEKAISHFEGKLFFQGVQPLHSLDEIPFFPKKRYRIMLPKMLTTGLLGQWMMKASSGIQTSIDYASIEDLQRKFVFLNRISPFLTAIFANSPIVEGSYSGYLSYRSHIWNNTDKTRSGLPKKFLNDNFLIEEYIDWALKVSPYHLTRHNKEIKTTNWSFKELLEGKNTDIIPTMNDWEEHLGMLFPDIRIKNILEVRVIDSLSPKFSIAVPALIGAIIYNESIFSSIQSKLMDLPVEDYTLYKKAASKEALNAEVRRTNFKKIGLFIVEKALEGLGSRDEDWLMPFFDNYTKEGLCPAEKTLELYKDCGQNSNIWFQNVLMNEDY